MSKHRWQRLAWALFVTTGAFVVQLPLAHAQGS